MEYLIYSAIVMTAMLLGSFLTYILVVDAETRKRNKIVQERNDYYRKMLFLERQVEKMRGEL